MDIDFSKLSIPFREHVDLWEKADKFRKQYWIEDIPVDIELIAERDLDMLMIPVEGLMYKAHTDAFISGDLKEIIYDPGLPDVRIRFSVAHEIGHYILHRDIIQKLRPGSYDEWKEIQLKIPEALWGRAEYQAREFAGRVLVPPEQLKATIKDLETLINQAKESIPDLEEEAAREFVSGKISRKFFVSAEVIKKRLEVENILIVS